MRPPTEPHAEQQATACVSKHVSPFPRSRLIHQRPQQSQNLFHHSLRRGANEAGVAGAPKAKVAEVLDALAYMGRARKSAGDRFAV